MPLSISTAWKSVAKDAFDDVPPAPPEPWTNRIAHTGGEERERVAAAVAEGRQTVHIPSSAERRQSQENVSRDVAARLADLQQRHPAPRHDERRTARREAFPEPIAFVALDESGRPAGDEIESFARDISRNGIGFYHTRYVHARFVVVTLPFEEGQEHLRLVAEVKRCEPIGQFYLVGCEFISFA